MRADFAEGARLVVIWPDTEPALSPAVELDLKMTISTPIVSVETNPMSNRHGSLSADQVNAEKAKKSRPDLIPGLARLAVGHALASGLLKHGDQTWRVEGTDQATPEAHIASAERHLAQCQQNLGAMNDTELPHLWHAATQLLIAIECIEQTKDKAPC